jgi:hypothetical protein
VLLVFVAVFGLVNRLLQPKYATDLVEGSMISQYYKEYGDHDVIFIGDCEVYANIDPMAMFRAKGVTAYVRGTSQQLIWQSYYLLKETLKYETPKAVVWNVNAMRYSEPVKEEFHRLTMDQMRWSEEKVGMILASMTEEETFLSYVFPILRYHSRFDKLTSEDFRYLFTVKDNTFNGYQMNKDILPVGTLPTVRRLANYQFGEICYEYLDKMRVLCEEKGVELILVKAPSLQPHWYEQYNDQMVEYAARHGLKFYNFVDAAEEIGIDYQTDTYDAGLHLNLAGATKMSQYFARILAEEHGIPDRRNDPEISELYDEKLRQYDAEANKESE